MALSFVAAASPVAQGFSQPAAQAAAPAPAANYAAPAAPAAPAMPVAVDNRNREAAYQPVPNMAPQPAAGKPQEQCIMVACSAQECMKNMTPQEQTEFKAQCEEMRREELQKAGASGKSRIAAGGFEMNYYQMYTLEEAAQKGIRADGKTAFLSTMSPNNQAPQEQCIMVACSAQECMKNMTPQEQTEFKAQCEEMRREELQKAGASGKSRIAAGGFEMNYYQMAVSQS
ncbi:hypothetical protein LPJ70_000400 [Coemansia sp. RSA 2708]|nr:hypothetical protein LPJ70_000400 [Coemansia sp. RSA 2708]